jgi:hypothetical protein
MKAREAYRAQDAETSKAIHDAYRAHEAHGEYVALFQFFLFSITFGI